ncbi:HypC/HybG/HupF family hydrogenase formation chaperone [Corynebacterium mendelii]|uniref:HypC/HybG/HupF family hydrogenase formation chaperone n=1 Tax=Corynebacterium mendelii TaxID=2765362 RepID=A0A939DZM9_9CORY|nr:HypC/HybG/HupF family hydrogenase formation chaperone [Corynebacterium mendelii]MBN9643978.1 HypC/HybG/HupF family hydrogenase formation chaperone [Corynebacterium mendelii]
MCVGVPAKITAVQGADGPLPMADIDMAGQERTCCLAYTPHAGVGDWVLIQNGFAHSVITDEDARASLAAIEELNLLQRHPDPR